MAYGFEATIRLADTETTVEVWRQMAVCGFEATIRLADTETAKAFNTTVEEVLFRGNDPTRGY